MVTIITTDPVPLQIDAHDTIRIANTRITLELVISAYLDGMTAEEIASEWPTLKLGDVYSVLGYYLHHKDEVDQYISQTRQEAIASQQKIEADPQQAELRTRLLARLEKKQ